MEAEHFAGQLRRGNRTWEPQASLVGYAGSGYISALPDTDLQFTIAYTATSPELYYTVNFTTTGTYYIWLRGYAPNGAGDSVYVGLDDRPVTILTGFVPRTWSWATMSNQGTPVVIEVTQPGLHTLRFWQREDGLRLDRLLLTTDTTFIPTGFGPPETRRLTGAANLEYPVDRVIGYDYDHLYRLTSADYSSGETYTYEYDPVGNRLKQIIDGDTTEYLYDAANRLAQVSHQSTVSSYQFDANGNLLNTGVMTNTWDAANRLTQIVNPKSEIVNMYNGVNDRVGQIVDGVQSHFALDVAGGLPEVIYTNPSAGSGGNVYLHLPGVIMAQSAAGELRYLLADGLGSVRQAVDDTGAVTAYNEYDPYGNPIVNPKSEIQNPYGFTGEWWENEVGLLHLRARWYAPGEGIFLSRDPVESEPPYQYVRGNPINLTDAGGLCAEFGDDGCWSVYEQIVHLCPECKYFQRATFSGDRYLHEENIYYLKNIFERVQNGWCPSSSPVSPIQDYGAIHDDRDLTFWLFDELKKGMENSDIQLIRSLNRTGLTPNAPATLAMHYWIALVRNRARYDFKHAIQDMMGETILFRSNEGMPIWAEYSLPGNIFFGFMSNYIGFPDYVVHAGAGAAQLADHFRDNRPICAILPTVPYLFDDPGDYRSVQFGSDLHRKYGRSLTLFQFRDELEQNQHQFPLPPQLPGQGNTPAYGWINSRGGWPYQVGRFNGDEEDEFWPPSFWIGSQ
jgi:RHS repeat-associated protein